MAKPDIARYPVTPELVSERLRAAERALPGSKLAEVSFAGFDFEVPAGVFDPSRARSSIRMLEALKTVAPRIGDRILEIGTGSGALTCWLWSQGHRDLWCTDVSDDAILGARRNFERYNVGANIMKSELFTDVVGSFDYIFFNAPIVHTTRLHDGNVALWSDRADLYAAFLSGSSAHVRSGNSPVLLLYSVYHDHEPLFDFIPAGMGTSTMLTSGDYVSEVGVLVGRWA